MQPEDKAGWSVYVKELIIMSMTNINYNGYGIDLGQQKIIFHSQYQKDNIKAYAIWKSFINNEGHFSWDEILDKINIDTSIITPCNTDSFDLLLLIENAYVVGETTPKTYTTQKAKEQLKKDFATFFDTWCKYNNFDNQTYNDLIKKSVDEMIQDHANYDYIQGPWYDCI